MDFSKRHTFAGITFKPTKTGTVRWSTVAKILRKGQVECYWYSRDGSNVLGSPESVLKMARKIGSDWNYLGEHAEYGNPRYAHKRFIRVSFHSNSFVTLYDLADLPELADGSEVDEVEACVGCDSVAEDPPALVEKGGLRLVVSN